MFQCEILQFLKNKTHFARRQKAIYDLAAVLDTDYKYHDAFGEIVGYCISAIISRATGRRHMSGSNFTFYEFDDCPEIDMVRNEIGVQVDAHFVPLWRIGIPLLIDGVKTWWYVRYSVALVKCVDLKVRIELEELAEKPSIVVMVPWNNPGVLYMRTILLIRGAHKSGLVTELDEEEETVEEVIKAFTNAKNDPEEQADLAEFLQIMDNIWPASSVDLCVLTNEFINQKER